MLSKSLSVLSLLAIFSFESLSAFHHPQQGIQGFYERKFEAPPPFEKIYVDTSSLVYMPDGIYLRRHFGTLEKVRCLSHDCKGAYVLRIHTQCPQCGKVYTGHKSPEGWSCLEN
jgi:hypothetical protein